MGDYGVRISKDNVDVKTGVDEDMVFSSKFGCYIAVAEGGGTAPAGAGDQTITISAVLDYPSVFYVWMKNGWKTNSWVCNYKSYLDSSYNLKLVIPAGVDYYYVITNKSLDPTIVSKMRPSTDDYGMKVSLPGVDVKTATWDQLAFIASRRVLQVLGSYNPGYDVDPFGGSGFGSYIYNPSTYYEFSVAHGKSYIPLFKDCVQGYRRDGLAQANLMGVSEAQITYKNGDNINQTINMEVCVDATYFWFRVKSTEGLQDSYPMVGVCQARALLWIIGGM